MNTSVDIQKQFSSYTVKLEYMLNELLTLIQKDKEALEGNCFYYHQSYNRFSELLNKQTNLFWAGTASTLRICEIGFNAGHSSLLFCLGSLGVSLDYTIFDINEHTYTRPCFEYIQTSFPEKSFEFIEGDSTVEIPKWIDRHPELLEQYDLVHIDGGHSEHCIRNDLINSLKLLSVNGLVIIDDTNIEYINSYVNNVLSTGKFEEVSILPTVGYQHRILKRIS
jgi:cephalosporin hydroxylase